MQHNQQNAAAAAADKTNSTHSGAPEAENDSLWDGT
jgi:hypothetical protein